MRVIQCMFWSNINSELEKLIKNHNNCLNFKDSNSNESLIPNEIPTVPWERIRTYLLQFERF